MNTLRNIMPVMALALLMTGCSTTQTGSVITPSRVKIVMYLATAFAVNEKPELKSGFQHAVDSLRLIESQESIDFAVIMAILNDLPVKELQTPQAKILITASTLLLSDLSGSLDLSKVENLRPYITAIREGIELGLK